MSAPKGWSVNVEGKKATIRVPSDQILNKEDKLRFPMRKLVAKLKDACPGPSHLWDYSDGWREVGTGYSRFILFKDRQGKDAG